jgi:hypothetical protein
MIATLCKFAAAVVTIFIYAGIMRKNNISLVNTNRSLAFVVGITALAGGCASDPLEPGAGNSPGEGTSTLLLEGNARATPRTKNAATADLFDTSFTLRITRSGAAVTTGTVIISDQGGKLPLTYDPSRDTGRWVGTQSGYYEVYQIDIVDGTDKITNVRVDGPDIHTITAPTLGASLVATAPIPLAWKRSDSAQTTYLDTRVVDKIQIPDTGAYMLPVGSVKSKKDQAENDTINLTRVNKVTPTGGAAGSTFEVRVSNSIDVLVAATGV